MYILLHWLDVYLGSDWTGKDIDSSNASRNEQKKNEGGQCYEEDTLFFHGMDFLSPEAITEKINLSVKMVTNIDFYVSSIAE